MGQLQQIRRTRGSTNASLLAAPQNVILRALRRLDYPDQARARAQFRLLTERNEQGHIPNEALTNASKQLDSMRARNIPRPRVAGVPTGRQVQARALLPPLAGLGPAGGPGPALAGWTALGPGNVGGRTRSIVVHPTNNNTMWAASVGGGIWRTDDGGANWQPVDDLMANLAVCCMAMDPTNPATIYAGTGEGFFNLDTLRGGGIFRTVDGTNWKQIPSTSGTAFQSVNRLAVSKNGKNVLAATLDGIYLSSDAGRTVWTCTLAGTFADVDFHPTDSRKAIAGSLDLGQAFYSNDGGQTWKEATHNAPWGRRVEVTYAVHDPRTVYASISANGGEIWRSNDGGRSYVHRDLLAPDGSPAMYLGDQGWYGNVIWAGDPTNADLVLVGGVDLWKSTDGGNTLVDISTWWDPRSAHADHHCIVASPGFDGVNNREVFFGNDGGIYKTDNVYTVGQDAQQPRIAGWVTLVNSYSVTQFYSGAGNPTSGTIVGGAQDNGTVRYTTAGGAGNWSVMFGGDGGWCAADPTDPNYFYGEYVYLNIHRSTDGGATSDYISGQYWNGSQWTWKPIPYRISDARNNDALFIAPFVLDPNSPDRILAGGKLLWRTNDAKTPNTDDDGPAWAQIKESAGKYISAIAVAPTNSDIIWVGMKMVKCTRRRTVQPTTLYGSGLTVSGRNR